MSPRSARAAPARPPGPRASPAIPAIVPFTLERRALPRQRCVRHPGIVPDVPDTEIPATGTAQVHILHEGYARESDGQERVGSTVTLIIDGDAVIVVDPGMVAARGDLLAAVSARGVAAGDVTDVVFSHHHPDHTVN